MMLNNIKILHTNPDGTLSITTWPHFQCRRCHTGFFIQMSGLRRLTLRCPACHARKGWTSQRICPKGISIYRPAPAYARGYEQCPKCVPTSTTLPASEVPA